MTVEDVLFALGAAFPSFNGKALGVWGPVFHSTLGKHEGTRLAQTHAQVLVVFDPTKRRISHPVVSDYLAQLPDFSRDIAKAAAGSAALDRTGHADRRKRLLDDWRKRQGARVSNGVPQVLSALETMAEQLANLAAWQTNPAPVSLTADEIRVALHRAISQERRDRFGPLHRTSDALWWQQITDVSHGWGFEAGWDDWRVKAREAEPAMSDEEIPL